MGRRNRDPEADPTAQRGLFAGVVYECMKCERKVPARTSGGRPRQCPRCGHGSIMETHPRPPSRLVPRRDVAPDLIVPASLHPAARPDLDRDQRMSALALSFPVLHNADCRGLEPWDVDRFASNHGEPWTSNASNAAILFVLSVWSGGAAFDALPPFDAHRALQLWSADQRGAFLAWAQRPWWA